MKKKLPEVRYSNPQPLTYYVADLEGDKKAFKILENVGRKVMTKQEYIMIGFNHIVANAKNNKFELSFLRKQVKKK